MVLRRFLKQYKMKKIHFKFQGSQDGRTIEKWMKTTQFTQEALSHAPLHMRQHSLLSHAPMRLTTCAAHMGDGQEKTSGTRKGSSIRSFKAEDFYGESETASEVQSKEEEGDEPVGTKRKMKIFSILVTVGKKLIRNPNTFASLIGLVWSSIQFRWGIHMPEVINHSIELLSNGGLGMAMFSLGLFMASQSSIIACGPRNTMVAIGLKVLVGPALMALASIVIGLRNTLFKVAIVQAALPQGIVPFVFAKEYNVHPSILSTAILLGMLIALPVELAFYFLLAL